MSAIPKFKICLTMAGAVSAGAFTAGVVDYLLETLDLWEKAKAQNRALGPMHPHYDHSIPMHEVELDVMSGASAGGITGALTLLNLIDAEYQPANFKNPTGINNRFYQSWVVMSDDAHTTTFEKMLALDDLEQLAKGEKPQALLNSQPLDYIADQQLQVQQIRPYPAYVSPSLDLILTTTNLRGINFKIDFGGQDKNGPVITSHAGFFRYKIANEHYAAGIPTGPNLYFVLDATQEKHLRYLKEATLSTAAFPIGLRSREVAISQEYVNRFPAYLFGKRTGIYPELFADPVYKFNSIDGGLINNEPFGIALKVLYEKNPAEMLQDRYAVVMIDPFPNKDHAVPAENPKADLLTVAKGMFRSLRNQVMFNQDGILDAIELKDRTKFLIEPVRKQWKNGQQERAEYDLAAAPFSGFAGFISQRFRQHDFELGRMNCQTFLRYYLGVPIDKAQQKLGQSYTQAARERFVIYEDRNDSNSTQIVPIIPDIRLLHARNGQVDTVNFGRDARLEHPEYPSMAHREFKNRLEKLMKRRVEHIANHLVENFWFSIANRLFIRSKIADAIQQTLENELREAGLLK